MTYEAQVVYYYKPDCRGNDQSAGFGKKCSIKAETIEDAVKQALAILKKNCRTNETWVRLRDSQGQEVATIYSESNIRLIEERPSVVSGFVDDRWDLI